MERPGPHRPDRRHRPRDERAPRGGHEPARRVLRDGPGHGLPVRHAPLRCLVGLAPASGQPRLMPSAMAGVAVVIPGRQAPVPPKAGAGAVRAFRAVRSATRLVGGWVSFGAPWLFLRLKLAGIRPEGDTSRCAQIPGIQERRAGQGHRPRHLRRRRLVRGHAPRGTGLRRLRGRQGPAGRCRRRPAVARLRPRHHRGRRLRAGLVRADRKGLPDARVGRIRSWATSAPSWSPEPAPRPRPRPLSSR
ncbi:MAG: hypothetical protein MZV63_46640 [Marinilabiliales bacterium]|nr:hypothetical protein [Marinilabiliales bacterium]